MAKPENLAETVARYGYAKTKKIKLSYRVHHLARQTPDGQWESKLGEGILIRHPSLRILEGILDTKSDQYQLGSAYGNVLFYYEKKLK